MFTTKERESSAEFRELLGLEPVSSRVGFNVPSKIKHSIVHIGDGSDDPTNNVKH